MSVLKLHAVVKNELLAVDAVIQAQLRSQADLTQEVGKYITQTGGKRLRPLLVLLGAGLFNHINEHAITLAAMIELIHTATLLHDDVVDESSLRRGKKTANLIWGNQASILVGDFLYSRGFQMLVAVKNTSIFEMMSKVTAVIAEGEILQLQNCHNPDVTEADYRRVIEYKTAMLFSVASRIGAILAQRTDQEIEAIAAYGLHLGIAFQLIDDMLDYRADPVQTGKNLGNDLAEGKPTLPLIYAIQVGTPAEKKLIQDAIRQGNATQLDAILQAIESTNAMKYVHEAAQEEAKKALATLSNFPDSSYRQALIDLADFAVHRAF